MPRPTALASSATCCRSCEESGTPNASDGIYNQSGGQTLLTVTQDGDGYAGRFEIGIQVA